MWEPWGTQSWLEPVDPPIKRFPKTGAVLGLSLGWVLERESDKRIIEAQMYSDTFLCVDPDGEFLFTVDPDEGVTALFYGESLRVKNVGIVG